MTRQLRFAILAGALVAPALAHAQDRLKSLPGTAQYDKMLPAYQGAVKSGSVLSAGGFPGRGGRAGGGGSAGVSWSADGKSVDYSFDGKRYRFDLGAKRSTELTGADAQAAPPAADAPPVGRAGRGGGVAAKGCDGQTLPPPERGRQSAVALSPDGRTLAHYHDRNVFVCDANGGTQSAITTDGSEKDRIKYGTASWVYGEELGQTTAMWWNPSSTKLAYFRFDESKVPDFYITQDETKLQTKLDVEAYPKSGVPNPIVELNVYDLATKTSTRIDVRDGKPFTNDVLGHYVYDVQWAPGGNELLLKRMNRRQQVLELSGCSPTTGKCRSIIHEEWPTGWVENHPPMRFLADSNRFIWESERTGFKNYYLYDLSGKQLGVITKNNFEVANIIRVDEKTNTLWYMGRDGDNYMKVQLHRVGLDGRNDRRITDPTMTHQIDLSPDGKYFIDVAQNHDHAPVSSVIEIATGKAVGQLATSDVSAMESRGLRKAEMYSYKAADGVQTLYGEIFFPSNFDPSKKYPVLTAVYGGPASGSNVPTETFSTGSPTTEYGFIVVQLSSRAAPGQGKRSLDAIYLKLGQTEMDDMAEGIKALWSRPYIDKNRVGIYGTSYGGYTSAMEILRHPEVFTVASSESPVTDWRHYDTIYTERYMWIPQENQEGYDKGSAMTYAKNLTGRLMLYYGTLDNNVHNTNMMQLVKSLQAAGKSFELQAGPDLGHTALIGGRRMEFFLENLIQHPERIHAGYEAVP